MSAHKLHVQWWDVSSFHFYHRTLNQVCSAAKSPNASLQCTWNSLPWNCVILAYPFVFCQTLVQGTGVSQVRAERDAASAVQLGCCCILAPSWGAQECPLAPAKHCDLFFLGLFGLPLPALMVAAMCTLIFVLFLSPVLLCATWSVVTHPAHCRLWWDMVAQDGEQRCQQGSFSSCSPAELCRQKDGSFQPLLQGTGFNEHNVQRAHCMERRCHRSVHRRGLGIYELDSPTVDLVGNVIPFPFSVPVHKMTV